MTVLKTLSTSEHSPRKNLSDSRDFLDTPGKNAVTKVLIWGVYVTSAFRNKGIARKTLEFLIDEIRGLKDVSQIQMQVETSNQNAQRLYAKMGFEKYGTEKSAIKIGQKHYDEDLLVLFI